MKIKKYYPNGDLGANAIHPVVDWSYVRKMVRATIKGVNIPPILIDGEPGSCNLLTGTHRAAANDILKMLGRKERIDWINLDDLDDDVRSQVEAAIDDNRYDTIDDIMDRAYDGSVAA